MKKIYLLLKNNIRNNRVTVSSTRRVDAGAGGVQLNRINAGDVHAYYPYGMRITDIFTSEADAYRYGGKEFEMMNDLQWHDFSARWYDQQLCCQSTSLHRPHRQRNPYLV